ncbi:MAG: PfkB family carbohydrate kinase [Bacillota bacterium]|nr:PfkB family carbohydrate kinase [Bacillota bacterium]MDW7682717.1 PfkB family carbohydrate kinase [Bacillota bacterium]
MKEVWGLKMAENNGRPVVFGEVLFDRFPDGTRVLGGAPFNVAWHLQGFGLHPLFISRVGRDDLGGDVMSAMETWGMDTAGVQLDHDLPTGAVEVSLADGEPEYDILPGRAYDNILAKPALTALDTVSPALLYHGTLAVRERVSADSLKILRDSVLSVFVDVNLRPPWWDAQRTAQLMFGTRWLKLNEDELVAVAALAGIKKDTPDMLLRVRKHFANELLVVTYGKNGACFIDGSEKHCGEPPPVDDVVDTVGAGDAFSAVTILGLLQSWEKETILERGLTFAAEICRERGALVNEPAFYREYKKRWGV